MICLLTKNAPTGKPFVAKYLHNYTIYLHNYIKI